MKAATHVLAGAAAWTGVAWLDSGGLAQPEGLAAAALGALLPDIDHPRSWFGRRMGLLSRLLSMVVGHRGITHSLLAVVMCLYGLLIVGRGAIAPAVLVGYLSHLLCDSLTRHGVPLLWPWRRPFGLRLVTTGGAGEAAFALVLAAATGMPYAERLWPEMFP